MSPASLPPPCMKSERREEQDEAGMMSVDVGEPSRRKADAETGLGGRGQETEGQLPHGLEKPRPERALSYRGTKRTPANFHRRQMRSVSFGTATGPASLKGNALLRLPTA